MSNWKQPISLLATVAGGFLLSFIAFGVLWIGVPWQYQFLIAPAFLALSFGSTRLNDKAAWFILAGAAPIGLVLIQFRDKSDSHLMPILLVFGWVLGVLVGRFLALRKEARDKIA